MMARRLVWMALVLGAANDAGAKGVGSSSAEFMNISPSTRASGMGTAFVGVPGDLGSLYHNPGGLAGRKTTGVHYLHAFWLEAISFDYLSAGTSLAGVGSIGTSVTRLFLESDRVGLDSSGQPVARGAFTASQISVALAWAGRVRRDLSVGASLKSIVEELQVSSGHAFAMDLGAMYETPLPRLTAGAAIANVGSRIDHAALPSTLRLGAGYELPAHRGVVGGFLGNEAARDVPLVSGEAHIHLASKLPSMVRLRAGLEYRMAVDDHKAVAVRLGYKHGEVGTEGLAGMTGGMGVRMVVNRMHFGLDYALVHFGALGLTHRVALTTDFAPGAKEGKTEVFPRMEISSEAAAEEEVVIRWPASGSEGINGYNVYMVGEGERSVFRKINARGVIPGTEVVAKGLKPATTYFFFVTTVDAELNEEAHHETKITTPAGRSGK